MQVQMNKAMAGLLEAAEARKAPIPSKLADLLSRGFVEHEGCYFLAGLYPHRGSAWTDLFPDATGYEAFINHLHLDDFTDGDDQLSVGLSYLDRQLDLWKKSQFAAIPISAIVSYDGDSCVVRFHALRTGERWLCNDLEHYEKDAVLVACL